MKYQGWTGDLSFKEEISLKNREMTWIQFNAVVARKCHSVLAVGSADGL